MKEQIDEAIMRKVAPDDIEKMMMPHSYEEIVNSIGSDSMSAVTIKHTIRMNTQYGWKQQQMTPLRSHDKEMATNDYNGEIYL